LIVFNYFANVLSCNKCFMLAGAGGRATIVSPGNHSISSAPSQSSDVSASHSATLSVSKPVVASQLIPIA
jgi:hypothetical protein